MTVTTKIMLNALNARLLQEKKPLNALNALLTIDLMNSQVSVFFVILKDFAIRVI